VPRPPVLDFDQRDPVEGQLEQRPRCVRDVLATGRLEAPGRPFLLTRQDTPQLPIGEHEVPLEDHEGLESTAIDAGVQDAPAFDGSRAHEHGRRRKAPVYGGRRSDAPLAAAGARIGIDGKHLDALDEHQALAVIVRTRLDAGIRALASRHRTVDRVVHIPFDDEKAGETAGDLIVC
jgi:hypothetical protein